MVHARLAALIPGVGCKIEHVPDMGRPQPRVAVKALQHILVVLGLIFLGVVAPAGVGTVEVGHALGTVLGKAQRTVGVHQMEKVHPQVIQEQARHIPAQIQVPADQIGDVCHRVEGAAHGVAGQRGQAGRVHLVAQLVEHPMVVQHIRLILGGNGDLVGHAPADDGGVVVVLVDELLHLADGVFPAIGQMLGDVGDLCPDHHAVLVAQVVEILVVLVVGQPDGVGTQLPDQRHVLIVHLPGDGIAQTLAVLMAGHTVKGIGPAVEEEALLCIHREAAQAHPGGHFVHRLAVLQQTNHTGVQVGVLHAVPQVGSIQIEGSIFAFALCNGAALGVQQLHRHGAAAFHQRFYLNVGAVLLQGRGDLHAGIAKVSQCDVVFVHHQQAHIPVDAAVEGEVRFLGINAVVDAVIHPHRELVFCLQQFRDLCPEGGVAAVMGAELLTVQQYGGAGVDALKLQPYLLLCRVVHRCCKAGAVGAAAPPVIVAAVLTVPGVPCMGQLYGGGNAVRAGELPVLHELCNTTHPIPPVFAVVQ